MSPALSKAGGEPRRPVVNPHAISYTRGNSDETTIDTGLHKSLIVKYLS